MRFFILTMMLFLATPASAETTFHFYGAKDCPPCMAFKRNHLETVRKAGEAKGFSVSENIIEHTAEVPEVGVFGDADKLLRDALVEGDLIPYPPIFFVTKNLKVHAVYGADWQAAMDGASTTVSQ